MYEKMDEVNTEKDIGVVIDKKKTDLEEIFKCLYVGLIRPKKLR